MKPVENVERLAKRFCDAKKSSVRTSPEMDSRVLGEVFGAYDKSRTKESAVMEANVWRIVAKSGMTKLAVAAVVIIGAAFGVIHWLPASTGPAQPPHIIETPQIPAPLAQMPVEQLLDIHFDKAESPLDCKLVTAAVESALDKLSARAILNIAKKYGGRGEIDRDMSARYRPVPPPALSKVVGASDFVVRGRVEQVVLDVKDVKTAILKKQLDRHWFEHRGAKVKAEVQLHVLEGYPTIASVQEQELGLCPVLHTSGLDVFEKGREYLVALQHDGDIMWMLPSFWGPDGVYPVDANAGTVAGLRNGSMSLDEAWRFVIDLHGAIHSGSQPSGETLEYWLAKLQSESLTDCWTAVEYFNATAEPPVYGGLVMDAVERHYDAIVRTYRENKYIFRWRAAFLKDVLTLLGRVADERTVERMLALYEQERAVPDGVFNDNAKEPYSRELRDAIARLAGKDQQTRPAPPAPSSGTGMRPRKEQIRDAITQYHQGKMHINKVMSIMRRLLGPTDNEFIPFLSEVVTSHRETPKLIAERLPDPRFVPVLREALKTGVTEHLICALYACGAEQEAIEIALAELDKPVSKKLEGPYDTEAASASRDFQKRASIVAFLGKTGQVSLLPVIEQFTRDDVINAYRQTIAKLEGMDYSVNAFERNAVLAFAKLGGKSAMPRLKKLYASKDIYIRILAAVALYAQGDETGYELLAHFVNHTERSVPEIEMRWRLDTSAAELFENAARYLKSARTDALLEERARRPSKEDL